MLDEIDLRLLYLLKHNARMSLTNIGKEIELSVPAVTYRINRLVKNGIIKNFTIDIDQDAMTPNYLSYVVTGRILKDSETTWKELHALQYFENIIKKASHSNFLGITRNMTTSDLKDLINYLEMLNVLNFDITTVLSKENGLYSQDIISESVSSIYCPLCQDKFDGEAIVTSIGSQIMGFCCHNCKQEFIQKYNEIAKTIELH